MTYNLNDQLDKAVTTVSSPSLTKPSESSEQRRSFLRVIFKELIHMALLNNSSAALLETWARDLAEFSETQIKVGLMKSKDFTGYVTLPVFRELCLSEDVHDHPMYRALPKEVFVPASEEKVRESLSKIKSLLG